MCMEVGLQGTESRCSRRSWGSCRDEVEQTLKQAGGTGLATREQGQGRKGEA